MVVPRHRASFWTSLAGIVEIKSVLVMVDRLESQNPKFTSDAGRSVFCRPNTSSHTALLGVPQCPYRDRGCAGANSKQRSGLTLAQHASTCTGTSIRLEPQRATARARAFRPHAIRFILLISNKEIIWNISLLLYSIQKINGHTASFT